MLAYRFAENLLRGSVATDQDSRLSWNDQPNRSAVKFAGEEDLDDFEGEEGALDDVSFLMSSKPGNIQNQKGEIYANKICYHISWFLESC